MTQRTIGVTEGNQTLAIDLPRLVASRMLVQANSGGGKSWALRRLLEQTHGKIQHMVIDPEGEFSTLRERFDYVLAAKHGGDTAADPRCAALLAERLLELGVSAILDIYELKPHERIRFVRLFLETLIDAPKKLWHPVLVLIDEAQMFAPQQGEAESLDAVKDLVSRGRKRGLCSVLATSRLSKLHKDAAAELKNKLIGGTSLDVDMKRAADELGFSKEAMRDLALMEPGEFWVFGPALVRVPTRVRIGPVQTTHPEVGSRLAATAPPATAKIKALLPKLADLPTEAEARAKSLGDLQQENIRLRREILEAKKAQPAPAKTDIKTVPALKAQDFTRIEKLMAQATALEGKIRSLSVAIGAEGSRFAAAIAMSKQQQAPHLPVNHGAPAGGIFRKIRKVKEVSTTPQTDQQLDQTGLTGPEQRIVNACAWLHSFGQDAPRQVAVAFLAGYTYGGGAFNNPRGALRVKGLVEYVEYERMRLTEACKARAEWPDTPLTAEELQQRVLAVLPGPEKKVLRVLLAAYPQALSNEDCAMKAGYTPDGGAYNNPRGRLRSLGLISYPSSGMVVAESLLFLGER